VARVSAVLHGSLSPDEILWKLSYADGLQFVTSWWENHFERCAGGTIYHGVDCRRVRLDSEGGELI
jgi:hypothetical protein